MKDKEIAEMIGMGAAHFSSHYKRSKEIQKRTMYMLFKVGAEAIYGEPMAAWQIAKLAEELGVEQPRPTNDVADPIGDLMKRVEALEVEVFGV